jgi:hypothetical protein
MLGIDLRIDIQDLQPLPGFFVDAISGDRVMPILEQQERQERVTRLAETRPQRR